MKVECAEVDVVLLWYCCAGQLRLHVVMMMRYRCRVCDRLFSLSARLSTLATAAFSSFLG